jgi:hypothetical protein
MVQDLGRLVVKDDGNRQEYGFAVCHEYDLFKQKGVVMVMANAVVGTRWTKDDFVGDCKPSGEPYKPHDINDRRSIKYLGCADRVEIRMVPMNSDNVTPGAEQSLVVSIGDVDSAPLLPKPFPPPPKPKDPPIACDADTTELGRLKATDDINGTTYSFVVCREKHGGVQVWSNALTSNNFGANDYRAVQAKAKKAKARACSDDVSPYASLGPGDQRVFHYRVCAPVKGPVEVEVEAVTLDGHFRGKPAQVLNVPLK